jgi:malate dehydrogenase (oxaloacetate-decarboxylating)
MLRASSAALAESSPCGPRSIDAGLLPPLTGVADASRRIALAVARAARDEGVAEPVDDDELRDRIEARWWSAAYPEIVPAR